MTARTLLLAILACMILPPTLMAKEIQKMTPLTITSSAFANNTAIPERYSCDGGDATPPLQIDAVPAAARSLAIVMDDPDAPAGTWVHWVAWNIPAHTREIGETALPAGTIQGLNSWKRNSYGGPCPPSGTHRYFFKLYALDISLNLPPSAGKASLEGAMRGHIIAQGELMGTYRRR